MATSDVNKGFKNWNQLFGGRIETIEQAIKAKRLAILGLLGLAVLQVGVGLFLWWASTVGTPIGIEVTPTNTAIIFFIIAVILYFFNSRIAAGALVVIVVVELGRWLLRGLSTGDFGGSGLRILLALIAFQVAVTFFKIHKLNKEGMKNFPRSKITITAMIITLVIIIGGVLIPPIHFLWHTETQVVISEKGNVVEYKDLADKYSFNFPTDWRFEHPPLLYGSVHLNPSDNDNVSIKIERWQPFDVAPVALYKKDAFLDFAKNEAEAYKNANNVTIDSVEFVDLVNISSPRVIYVDADGAKKYVFYIYNRGWSRQTSDGDWFFWRITATVPKEFQQYEKNVESITSSFTVNQNIVR